MLSPAPVIVELARLTYAPKSGGMSQTPPGPSFLVVESGALAVQLRGMGTLVRSEVSAHVVHGGFTLHGGDGLVLPETTTASFHNGGPTPVVALVAGVFSTLAPTFIPGKTESSRWDASWSPGATVQPLGGGWLVDPPTGPAAIDLKRLSFQSGALVPLTSPGAAVLSVEAGALTLLAGQGLIWQQSPAGPDGWVPPASAATLLPGDGVLLQDRPQVTIRNDGTGPLLLLVLTVAPTTDRTATPPDRR
jgi:hypothetical protein